MNKHMRTEENIYILKDSGLLQMQIIKLIYVSEGNKKLF